MIASYISLGGLGAIISTGISLNDNDLILGGALLVTVLALGIDGLFALAQHLTRRGPEGQTRGRRTHVRALPVRRRAVTALSVDERDH